MTNVAKTYKNQAVIYIRTSSGSNLGDGKDSEPRQRQKIAAYAKTHGIELVAEFRDPAVKGSEGLEGRPGFSALLARIEGNGVRMVICEDASRLARDLLTQELGIILLQKLGVTLMTATGENLTQTDDAMKKAMRQIAGAFSELEKARLVAKLKHARDAKRQKNGKCEGRKSISVQSPEATAMAIVLKNTMSKPSLRRIAAALAAEGLLSDKGGPFKAQTIAAMLATPRVKSISLTA